MYVFDGSGNNCSFPLNPGTGYTCPYATRSAVTRAYDNYNPTTQQWNAGYGNVVSETIYGNYDLPGDEVTLTYSYSPNSATFIVSKPSAIATYAGVGTGGSVLSSGVFYYDGATSSSTPPAFGKPTQSFESLDTTGAYVARSATYDSFGNVKSETDETNGTTSYTIDPTYNQFVTQTTNALGQSSSDVWDPGCGVRTQTTDVNGQTSYMTYDKLCRLTYTRFHWAPSNSGSTSTQAT